MQSPTSDKPKILVVDDDQDMVALLQDLLRQAGFDADGVDSGTQALQSLEAGRYALVLLDLRLKGEDGFTLAQHLRQMSTVPIIMLAGSAHQTDRVLLLQLGAEDFLIKPFSPHELVSRVDAALRRCGAVVPSAPDPAARPRPDGIVLNERLAFDQWVLDLGARELRRADGAVCPLTPAEFRLLETFVRDPQRVWTRDELMLETHDDDNAFGRTLDVLLLRLRRKIEPDPRHPRYIRMERGLGYLFAVPVDRL